MVAVVFVVDDLGMVVVVVVVAVVESHQELVVAEPLVDPVPVMAPKTLIIGSMKVGEQVQEAGHHPQCYQKCIELRY